MFRVVMDLATVNCDQAIVKLFQMVKDMQESGLLGKIPGLPKLPSSIDPSMLTMLPQDQKLNMMIQGATKEKQKTIGLLQKMLSDQLGSLEFLDYQLGRGSGCEMVVKADIGKMDYDRVIDLILEHLLKEEDIPEILGDNYEEALTMDNIGFFMHGQADETKEYLILKSLKAEKETVKKLIEQSAASKDVITTVADLRFFLKQD